MKRLTLEVGGARVDAKVEAERLGLCWPTVYQRIVRGWSVEDAFTKSRQVRRTQTRLERIAYHRDRVAYHQAEIDWLEAEKPVVEVQQGDEQPEV
jgi:hypothetical protein